MSIFQQPRYPARRPCGGHCGYRYCYYRGRLPGHGQVVPGFLGGEFIRVAFSFFLNLYPVGRKRFFTLRSNSPVYPGVVRFPTIRYASRRTPQAHFRGAYRLFRPFVTKSHISITPRSGAHPKCTCLLYGNDLTSPSLLRFLLRILTRLYPMTSKMENSRFTIIFLYRVVLLSGAISRHSHLVNFVHGTRVV